MGLIAIREVTSHTDLSYLTNRSSTIIRLAANVSYILNLNL